MNIPIIRLEVEHMRQTMAFALTEYTTRLDVDLHNAIDAYCTPENLRRVIEDEANRTLDQVIREQVKAWFIYGEGREVIKRAVEQKLRDGTTWTPLDEEAERTNNS
jgi:hypothetical protein